MQVYRKCGGLISFPQTSQPQTVYMILSEVNSSGYSESEMQICMEVPFFSVVRGSDLFVADDDAFLLSVELVQYYTN